MKASLGLLIMLVPLVVGQTQRQPSSAYVIKSDGTRGGNSPNRPCAFPFKYNGVSYYVCPTIKNQRRAWCSTTSDYNNNKQYGNCRISMPANRTKNGNSPKSYCVFPSIYKGRELKNCTTDDWKVNRPWCPTSANYDRDKKWAECVRYQDIKTSGGNGNGAPCVFPFKYRGKLIQGCITRKNNGVGWCGTTENYEQDRIWGNCIITTIVDGASSNCPNGNTYQKYPATLTYGGQGRTGPTGPDDADGCKAICDSEPTCQAFDYDKSPGLVTRCYLHLGQTNLNQKVSAVNVDQYVITNRCTNSGSSGSSGTQQGGISCPNGNTYQQYSNQLSYSGTPTQGPSGVNDHLQCRAICDKDTNCLGYDYDTNSSPPNGIRCYIHTNSANFAKKEPSKTVNQYAITNRCSSSSGATPSSNQGSGSNRQTIVGGDIYGVGGDAGSDSRCASKWKYNGETYTSCTSEHWYYPWCSTTSDFNKERKWLECDNIPTN